MKTIVVTFATIILFSSSGFLASGEVSGIKVYNLLCYVVAIDDFMNLSESATNSEEILTRPMTEKDVEENSDYDSAIVGKPHNKGGQINFNDYIISYKIIGSPSLTIFSTKYRINVFNDNSSEAATRLGLTIQTSDIAYKSITCTLKLKEIGNN